MTDTIDKGKLTVREMEILKYVKHCETASVPPALDGAWMRRSGKGAWRFYVPAVGWCGGSVEKLRNLGMLNIEYHGIGSSATLTEAGHAALKGPTND